MIKSLYDNGLTVINNMTNTYVIVARNADETNLTEWRGH